jgi:hypothetical protein
VLRKGFRKHPLRVRGEEVNALSPSSSQMPKSLFSVSDHELEDIILGESYGGELGEILLNLVGETTSLLAPITEDVFSMEFFFSGDRMPRRQQEWYNHDIRYCVESITSRLSKRQTMLSPPPPPPPP